MKNTGKAGGGWRSALRPIKRSLVDAIRNSPIPSTRLGPPKRVDSSAKNWADGCAGIHDALYREVVPKEEVFRTSPQTPDAAVNWKFTGQMHQEHAPCFVVSMKNGRVWGRCGTVITPDDVLLRDVSRESQDEAAPHSAQHRLRLGPLQRVEKRVAVIATAWSYGYFHWMLDVLPRVELLRRAGMLDGIEAFIVAEDGLPFQRQALERAGLKPDRLIVADDPWRFHLQAAELVVPSLPSALGTPMKWACQYVRGLYEDCRVVRRANPRRLYISRAQARGRRVLNEADVRGRLATAGFEYVELDTLSVTEQARLFSEAECIVAPHGAGLTNILFCEPGTCIVDIFAPTYINPCYWVMANELNLAYCYLIGEGERPKSGEDPDKKGDDISVNVAALMELLASRGFP
jgi:capsular polysaccharide biosynthesis protein